MFGGEPAGRANPARMRDPSAGRVTRIFSVVNATMIGLGLLALLSGLLALASGLRRAARRVALLALALLVASRMIGAAGDVSVADPSAPSRSAQGTTASALVYVAIGDSYASGQGTGVYFAETDRGADSAAGPRNVCHRSPLSYPELLVRRLAADGHAVTLRDVTCSGATTADLDQQAEFADAPPQISALDASTRFATIQIGGNDLGFAAALDRCVDIPVVHPRTPCAGDIGSLIATRAPGLSAALDRTFAAARSRAPHATFVVVGYPMVFELDELPEGGGRRCSDVRRADVVALIRANATLNELLHAAADRAGFGFAPLDGVFDDHGLCGSGADWISGLYAAAPTRSFHPDRPGHAAVADSLIGSGPLRSALSGAGDG